MRRFREFAIEVQFEKRADGRYYVYSHQVSGLRLGGTDLEAICADIEPAVKHLLKHNAKIDADQVRWDPPFEEIQRQFNQPAQGDGKTTGLVKFKAA
jgi:hypothetical protein